MIIKQNQPLPEELANIPASKFQQMHKEEILDEEFQTKPIGFWKDALIRLTKSKVSVISFSIIMLIVLAALFVPSLTGFTYTEQNVDYQ